MPLVVAAPRVARCGFSGHKNYTLYLSIQQLGASNKSQKLMDFLEASKLHFLLNSVIKPLWFADRYSVKITETVSKANKFFSFAK